jgi:hypothetical protein
MLSLHRRGRDRKHDRVGLRNEPAETILPRLAGLDLVTVDSRRKTSEFKPGDIGDEDLGFSPAVLTSSAMGYWRNERKPAQ